MAACLGLHSLPPNHVTPLLSIKESGLIRLLDNFIICSEHQQTILKIIVALVSESLTTIN